MIKNSDQKWVKNNLRWTRIRACGFLVETVASWTVSGSRFLHHLHHYAFVFFSWVIFNVQGIQKNAIATFATVEQPYNCSTDKVNYSLPPVKPVLTLVFPIIVLLFETTAISLQASFTNITYQENILRDNEYAQVFYSFTKKVRKCDPIEVGRRMVAVLRVLHVGARCQRLSCCYGDSTVTLTKCEITQWSGFVFQRPLTKMWPLAVTGRWFVSWVLPEDTSSDLAVVVFVHNRTILGLFHWFIMNLEIPVLLS